MSEVTWVRFFPSDWLAGTRSLTAAESGVYVTLVSLIYERGGYIKEDRARLARLCGASNSAFKKALETLIEEGKLSRDGSYLTNKRALEELSYSREKSEVGRSAAKSRWQGKSNKNNDRVDADAMPTQCDGIENADAYQNQSQNQRKESSHEDSKSAPKRASASKRSETHPPDRFDEFWDVYPHRGGAKKGKAPARRKWDQVIKSGADPDAIIEGARRAHNDASVQRGYAKDPATWLNQRGWEDEVEQHQLKAIQGGQSESNDQRRARWAKMGRAHEKTDDPLGGVTSLDSARGTG